MVNNYGIFLISILNVKLNFAVGTKHNRYVLAFRISNTDYCVKSLSVVSSVTKPRIIFFFNLTNDDTIWKANTRLFQNQ